MSYRILPPEPSNLGGLLSLIGGIVGKNSNDRNTANMYGDIASYNDKLNNLDTGNQVSYQDLTQQGQATQQQANQGLFGNTNIQPQSTEQLSAGIGKGLGLFGQQQAPQPQIQPVQQSNFTYNNPANKYSNVKTDSKISTSAPQSIQQQTKLIKSQMPMAMNDLMSKGYDPKVVLPLLQQATQDKITEHTQNYQQQQIEDLYKGFQKAKTGQEKVMYATRLGQMGIDVTKASKEYEVSATDQYKTDHEDARWLTPSGNNTQNNQIEKYKWDNPSANNTQTSQTSIAVANMRGVGGGGSRSTGGTGQNRTEKINGMTNLQINNEISKYKQW